MAVSIRPASQRTKRMKEPTRMAPGMRVRCEAMIMIIIMKTMPRAPITTPKGMILCGRMDVSEGVEAVKAKERGLLEALLKRVF